MKRALSLLMVLTLLAGYALMAAGSEKEELSFFGKKNESGENIEDINIVPNVMPNVVGMSAGEAQQLLKKAKINVQWEYTQSIAKEAKMSNKLKEKHIKYIIQTYGNENHGAPPESCQKVWEVIKQSVEAGKEKIDNVTLTMDLKIITAENNEDFYAILNKNNSLVKAFVEKHKGEVIYFKGTIKDVFVGRDSGLLSRVIFSAEKSQGATEEEKNSKYHMRFDAYKGPPDSSPMKENATFEIIAQIRGDYNQPDWIRIDILAMNYLLWG